MSHCSKRSGKLITMVVLGVGLLCCRSASSEGPKGQVDLSPARWSADERARFEKYRQQFTNHNVLVQAKSAVITGTTCAPAVRCGLEAMKQGGTAADAVLTTSLAQIAFSKGAWVSYAGVMTMVYYEASTGKVHNLNAAFNTVLAEDDPMSIPQKASGRTALVPGYMAGVEAAHQRFGKLPFAALFDPAIYYAEEGFRLTNRDAAHIKGRIPVLSRLPETKRLFTKADGTFVKKGDLFRQPDVAATLRKVAQQGARYMYTGEWARKLVAALQKDGGKLSLEDLSQYRALWTDPVCVPFHGHTVFAHGLPALGGVNVAEALNVATEAKLIDRGHYTRSAESFFWLSQINNLFVLSNAPAEARTRLLGTEKHSPSIRVTQEHARHVWKRMQSGKIAIAKPPSKTPSHSDAVVAIDRWGNVAAICHTINTNNWGKTGIIVDGVSIPDSAVFQRQLIKATGPGKRLPDTTVPVIVLKGGKPVAGYSSIGMGLHQRTVCALINLIAYKMDIKQSLETPSFHLPQWDRELFVNRSRIVDKEFDQSLLTKIDKMGLKTIVLPSGQRLSHGRGYIVAAGVSAKDGQREAIATPVLNARALGY